MSKPDLRLVRTMPVQKPGKSKQDYATPDAFIEVITHRFGNIDVDLAATEENRKAELFVSPEQDSLTSKVDWDFFGEYGRCKLAFLNPPYNDIAPWAKKCAQTKNLKILFLVPASMGSNWWAEHVHGTADRVIFVRPRLSFDGKAPYPKDCALIVYNEGGLKIHNPFYECWSWR